MNIPKANVQPPNSINDGGVPSAVATIETQIEGVLRDKVSKRDLPQVAQQLTQIVVSERFSGPMPHPKHFREYEAILPGAGDRILLMAEKNLEHSMQMDKDALEAEKMDRQMGMVLGAGLFALLILAAFIALVWTGSAVGAGLFLGAATVGSIGLFIKGRNSK